jgi:hypothetical protein
MALEFLESELRLSLKNVETLRAWQLHYLRLAEELLALAGQWGHDPELQRGLDMGADLCAAQAEKLRRMVGQRENLEGRFINAQLVGARHVLRMAMEKAEKAAKAAGVAA